MTYSLIALIIALSVFGCIILLNYRKKCLKRTGEASLSAVSEFEGLSHPTRLFSSDEVNNFLEENKQLVGTVRGYMKSIFKKKNLLSSILPKICLTIMIPVFPSRYITMSCIIQFVI